ncbi:hypothetical protein D3C74_399780 [compost metagenome]
MTPLLHKDLVQHLHRYLNEIRKDLQNDSHSAGLKTYLEAELIQPLLLLRQSILGILLMAALTLLW